MTDEQKEPLRQMLLAAHPEWSGRIRIYRNCVSVRDVCTVWARNPDASIEDEAQDFVALFEDFIERHGR